MSLTNIIKISNIITETINNILIINTGDRISATFKYKPNIEY